MEIDPNTEVPTNRLTEEAIQFCKSVGSKAETVDDIAGIDPKDGIIQDEIKKALQRANEVCVCSMIYQTINLFGLVMIMNL